MKWADAVKQVANRGVLTNLDAAGAIEFARAVYRTYDKGGRLTPYDWYAFALPALGWTRTGDQFDMSKAWQLRPYSAKEYLVAALQKLAAELDLLGVAFKLVRNPRGTAAVFKELARDAWEVMKVQYPHEAQASIDVSHGAPRPQLPPQPPPPPIIAPSPAGPVIVQPGTQGAPTIVTPPGGAPTPVHPTEPTIVPSPSGPVLVQPGANPGEPTIVTPPNAAPVAVPPAEPQPQPTINPPPPYTAQPWGAGVTIKLPPPTGRADVDDARAQGKIAATAYVAQAGSNRKRFFGFAMLQPAPDIAVSDQLLMKHADDEDDIKQWISDDVSGDPLVIWGGYWDLKTGKLKTSVVGKSIKVPPPDPDVPPPPPKKESGGGGLLLLFVLLALGDDDRRPRYARRRYA